MQVLLINNFKRYDQVNSKQKNLGLSFRQNKDFTELTKKFPDVLMSSYFRRGITNGASIEYRHVINAITSVYTNETTILSFFDEPKKKVLIGGIGESQEPFSLLAIINSYVPMQENKLADLIDLHVVDLQSKPDNKTLFIHSFCDLSKPIYAESSFVADNGSKYGLPKCRNYRVSDNIFQYLSQIYNNPRKSKWETRIQDAVKKYANNSFHIISVNNTLSYINNYGTVKDVLLNIYRILKPNGIYITDYEFNKKYKGIFSTELVQEIHPGIYKKLV